jgi:hypothetical protein
LVGNASNSFDINLFVFPLTLNLNGTFTQTGGQLDLSTRNNSFLPGGAFILNSSSTFNQTGGIITSSQDITNTRLEFNGASLQNVGISTVQGPFYLEVNNPDGIKLTRDLVLNGLTKATSLLLTQGFTFLENFNVVFAPTKLTAQAGSWVVTNGNGVLTVAALGVTASQILPIGPSATSYNPVTIQPQPSVSGNYNYSVRVITGQ